MRPYSKENGIPFSEQLSLLGKTVAFLFVVGRSRSHTREAKKPSGSSLQTAKLTPAQRAEVRRYRKKGNSCTSGIHGRAEIASQKVKSNLKP
jgi:hypothetical protein